MANEKDKEKIGGKRTKWPKDKKQYQPTLKHLKDSEKAIAQKIKWWESRPVGLKSFGIWTNDILKSYRVELANLQKLIKEKQDGRR